MLVYLHDRDADLSKSHVEEVSSCCTFNKTLNSHFFRDEELKPVTPRPWSPQRIFELACAFESDTPVHKRTFGAHSCYLANEHEILYCYEDLGRHNAFDKVIGSALIDGVDLSGCIVFTSGRIPTDMAVKAVRAGVPIIVSKAVPTDLTIEMARKYDLTLICSAHHDSMKVFNDPYGALNEHREAQQAKVLPDAARPRARVGTPPQGTALSRGMARFSAPYRKARNQERLSAYMLSSARRMRSAGPFTRSSGIVAMPTLTVSGMSSASTPPFSSSIASKRAMRGASCSGVS